MDIRDSLRFLVDESGLNQSQIAKASGISGPYLSNLLTKPGKTPSAFVLDKIARALGVTVDDILHPETGVIEEPDSRVIVSCIRCGSRNSLSLVPHRFHNDSHADTIVGWIYTCQRCCKFVVSGSVAVTYHSEPVVESQGQPDLVEGDVKVGSLDMDKLRAIVRGYGAAMAHMQAHQVDTDVIDGITGEILSIFGIQEAGEQQ